MEHICCSKWQNNVFYSSAGRNFPLTASQNSYNSISLSCILRVRCFLFKSSSFSFLSLTNVISYDNELVLYVAPCNTSYSSFKVMFLCCFRRLENSIIIISLTPFGIIASGHSYHLTWCSSWKASLCPILNDSRQQLCTVHSNRGFYSCLVLYSFPFHHISKHKYPLYSFNSVCYQSYPVMK